MELLKLKKKIVDHRIDHIKDMVEEIQINADTNEEILRKLYVVSQRMSETTALIHRNTIQMKATQQQIQETQKELADLTTK